MIEIKNLTYRVEEKTILKNINLAIEEGEFLFIMGSSGSGKSTLLRILGDLITASQGDIIFNNKNYKDYNPEELRKVIGYCSQGGTLFEATVRDNLEFPYKIRHLSVDINRIEELLKTFNLSIDYLEKDITTLSGGERQRIALIRTFLILPKVLLLDEATSALDEENKLLVENFLVQLNKRGTTILWVTHDSLQYERIGGRLIAIEQGEVISGGDL